MRLVRDSRRFIETLEDLLRRGYPVRFRADGWSMYPAIRNGDVITVAPLAGSPIRVGEVVLYRHGQAAIAHRIVAMRSFSGALGELLPRGDATDACDAPIAPDQVVGRVVAVERAGGRRRRSVSSRGWSRLLGRMLRAAHSARTTLAALVKRT